MVLTLLHLTIILELLSLINAEQVYVNLFQNKKNEINYDLPEGFTFVNPNITNGPITINKEKDDGTKRNLFNMINHESDHFYYNHNEFNKLTNETEVKSEYFCEMYYGIRPERMTPYEISCPAHYTIVIDKAFYGRYANDTENCPNSNITPEVIEKIKPKDCGYEPINFLKERCEGRQYCNIIVKNFFFKDRCYGVFKYLNVKYHCVKEPELKKERIAIVMFSNRINPNSIDENSISEFYQYSKIHGYDFFVNTKNYNPDRKIYYMKTLSVLEKVIEGLKENKYDWIFWADSDTMIMNPNIKLESFLPNEKMNKVHFIAGVDWCGLQAGVFFIRVHEWSLNMLMRALSYCYYVDKFIIFDDQSSINNVLTGEDIDESEHYVIVPQKWFNNHKKAVAKGDFLLHIMGDRDRKDEIGLEFRNRLKGDDEWNKKTNEEMRKEVLEYYDLPKDKQLNIKYQ
ncbi:hypothetical protein BCR32DRAFT_226203 [Anaeromyces robustus]|uniref:SUEL-type lectin domain-containing protein n=1 Tax=Anaeromyces robustus TaxID=1754192 RepID=A0A1Y1VVA0_9FUNG|nr:hypothetical protein BCR32DRAFT_226203 [Anaeromyces robustus]|eukprot:ORX65231.1 hypothetical protein BCR32DRAFT_226203 [Anaeromyces robustus]